MKTLKPSSARQQTDLAVLKGLPTFVALRTHQLENIAIFSPQVMVWRKDIWLWDLRLSLSYLVSQQRSSGLSFLQYLKTLLQHNQVCYGDFVASSHPWLAILAIELLAKKKKNANLQGEHVLQVFDFVQPGQNLAYLRYPWSIWERSALRLGDLWREKKHKHFDFYDFKNKIQRLVSLGKRLNLASSAELSRFDTGSLMRRFGIFATALLQWEKNACSEQNTYEPNSHTLTRVFAAVGAAQIEFPWCSQIEEKPLSLTRHLDYPIKQWSELEPLLQEDSNRLSRLEWWHSHQHIVSLQWRLRLSNFSEVSLLIRFRTPYHLTHEAPLHLALLKQACYGYAAWQNKTARKEEAVRQKETVRKEEAVRQKETVSQKEASWQKNNHEKNQCYDDSDRAIISWDLTILEKTDTVKPTPSLGNWQPSLSSAESSWSGQKRALGELENLLPMTLREYQPHLSWQAEHSYRLSLPLGEPLAAHALDAAASQRPPILYRQPEPLASPPVHERLRFQERVSIPWWQDNDAFQQGAWRIYYRYHASDQRDYWIFHQPKKGWFVHGIYA